MFQISTENEENGSRFNKIKQEYELEISDLKQDIQRLQNKFENNETSRNALNSEYQSIQTRSTNLENQLTSAREENGQLKQTNNILQQEITTLENQS